MVLYRKYRPQKLSDLVGHEQIKNTLLSQLEGGKIGHGYLFFGPKGTGKTSTARILAKAVNCEGLGSSKLGSRRKILNAKPYTLNAKFGEPCNKCILCLSITDGSSLDVIEIDAASNRGIDEVRDLREKIKLSPVSGKFKVYIIDEAHMLTNEAFNALLKTLEEPPAHVIFILCTTEVAKLPGTIVSRLARFNFARANTQELAQVLARIAKAEGIKIDQDAVVKLAQISEGSFRDAISLLDQVSASSQKVTGFDVEKLAKGGSLGQINKFVSFIAEKNLKDAVLFVEDLAVSGADIAFFVKQVIVYLEKILFIKIGIKASVLGLDPEDAKTLEQLALAFELEDLQSLMRSFLVSEGEIKLYPLPQIPLVLALCKNLGDGAASEKTEDSKGIERIEEIKDIDDDNVEKVSPRFAPQDGASSGKQVSQVRNVREVRNVRGLDERSDNSNKARLNSKSKSKTLSKIEEKWPQFLNKVKGANVHILALLKSSRPLGFDGQNLTLEVFYRFHKDKLEEPKIINILGSFAKEIYGQKIDFRFTLAKKETKLPRIVEKSNVLEIEEGDLAQIAQEIFSK